MGISWAFLKVFFLGIGGQSLAFVENPNISPKLSGPLHEKIRSGFGETSGRNSPKSCKTA